MAIKQRSVRLPDDISKTLEAVAGRYGLDETDVIRRALRSYLRRVIEDKDALLSKDATEELPVVTQ